MFCHFKKKILTKSMKWEQCETIWGSAMQYLQKTLMEMSLVHSYCSVFAMRNISFEESYFCLLTQGQ